MQIPRRIYLVLPLLFAVGSVSAQLKIMDRDDYGASYIDLSTKRKTSSGYSVWTLYDADVPTRSKPGEWAHSTRVWHEFNCIKSEARTLVMVKYESRMAAGRVLEVADTASEWSAVSPTTGRQKILQLVCP